MNYATINDLETVWRELTDGEKRIAEELITVVSAEIRRRAADTGRDFDKMIEADPDLLIIARSVVCDVVKRSINDLKMDAPAMSQMTESAMGYSFTGTFLAAGGGVFMKRSELARLGLKRPRVGVINVF